uniref:PEROXIDASE_4 domain-containing protein n=1 Tax=Haemonchus contortus TaxID=6289 RepID=A0A7I4Z1F0_HAECO
MPGESFYSEDFRFLANIHRNPSSLDLKVDFGATWQELQDRYKQAEELDVSWTYRRLFTTMCPDASAGEFALFNIHFLKTAITVKDNLLRLTQRLCTSGRNLLRTMSI